MRPLPGQPVFDGDLDLDEYRICVRDIEELRRDADEIARTIVEAVTWRSSAE